MLSINILNYPTNATDFHNWKIFNLMKKDLWYVR